MAVGTSGGLGCADLFAEGLQFAGLEQRAQRQFDVAGLAGARDDAGGQQGMPAELEEIVAQADPRQAEHFAPDHGDAPLQLGPRLDVLALLPDRLRQRPRIQLAARAEGHLRQAHQLRRDHVFRQFGL